MMNSSLRVVRESETEESDGKNTGGSSIPVVAIVLIVVFLAVFFIALFFLLRLGLLHFRRRRPTVSSSDSARYKSALDALMKLNFADAVGGWRAFDKDVSQRNVAKAAYQASHHLVTVGAVHAVLVKETQIRIPCLGMLLNGNFMKDCPELVAGSAPPDEARGTLLLEALLRMQIKAVVQLTGAKEAGLWCYYPADCKDKSLRKLSLNGSHVCVSALLGSTESRRFLSVKVRRKTESKRRSDSTVIDHFHFKEWADCKMPASRTDISDMAFVVFHRYVEKKRRVFVHCNSGIGRTGSFVLALMTLRQIAGDADSEAITPASLVEIAKNIRHSRYEAIQSASQFMYGLLLAAAVVAKSAGRAEETEVKEWLEQLDGQFRDLEKQELRDGLIPKDSAADMKVILDKVADDATLDECERQRDGPTMKLEDDPGARDTIDWLRGGCRIRYTGIGQEGGNATGKDGDRKSKHDDIAKPKRKCVDKMEKAERTVEEKEVTIEDKSNMKEKNSFIEKSQIKEGGVEGSKMVK